MRSVNPLRTAYFGPVRCSWKTVNRWCHKEGSGGVKRIACGARNLISPFSVLPFRRQAGAGGFPPRRKHAACQPKALATRAAAAPLCIPCAYSGCLELVSEDRHTSDRETLSLSGQNDKALFGQAGKRAVGQHSQPHPSRADILSLAALRLNRLGPASRTPAFHAVPVTVLVGNIHASKGFLQSGAQLKTRIVVNDWRDPVPTSCFGKIHITGKPIGMAVPYRIWIRSGSISSRIVKRNCFGFGGDSLI